MTASQLTPSQSRPLMERQMIFSVKFPSGKEVTAHADCEEAALSRAFMDVTRPIYCRIHSEIAKNSDAPVGAMGMYYPPSEYPVSARQMKYGEG